MESTIIEFLKNWKRVLLSILGLLTGGVFTISILSNNNIIFNDYNNGDISINSPDCRYCNEYIVKKDGFEGRILVLGQDYSWKYADTELVEHNISISQIIPAKLNQDGLKKCTDIIAIGTASEESIQGIEVENERAKKRANNIIRELRPVVKKDVNLFKLVLGKYIGGDNTTPEMQRRIIVIGIFEKTESTFHDDLKWALKQHEDSLQLNISNYALFELKNTSKMLIK